MSERPGQPLSEHTKPALTAEEKSLFDACFENHQRQGTNPKEFKLSKEVADYFPGTLWATKTFKDYQNLDVKIGVGVHWKNDKQKISYEFRLKYASRIENKINLRTIEKAEKYFPREMLDIITKNGFANRKMKEEAFKKKEMEERQKNASARNIIAPLARVKKTTQVKKKSLLQQLAAFERKGSSRKSVRAYAPAATMTAANTTVLCMRDN